AEQEYYQNNQTFDSAGTGVAALETSLNFGTAAVTPGNNVQLTADSANGGVILTSAGADGKCYSVDVINDSASSVVAGTYYGINMVTPTGTGKSTSCDASALSGPSATPTGSASGTPGPTN